MREPVIQWDTSFGAVTLSTYGTGISDSFSAPQSAIDEFGEENLRCAYISKRMQGRGEGCGTRVTFENILLPDTLIEIADSEFIHAIKLSRNGTVGWLALMLLERKSHNHDPNRNATTVRVENKSITETGLRFDLCHDSNCKVAGVSMLYAASSSSDLKKIPSWFYPLNSQGVTHA